MSRAQRWALAALLAASFALRLWVAQVGTDPRHAYDERFSVRNVAYILHTGKLTPENGFHPSLSFLPHLAPLAAAEAIYRTTGRPAWQILDRGPGNEIGRSGRADGLRLTPLGYRLARGVNGLIGTLSIWICFLAGRRLFGPRVGLFGAFLLAVVPWHLRQSAVFKPDIVVVTAMLLAFYWALRAARSDRAGDWALAGAGIGLSLAAKFNAAPAALPITLAALWRVPRERRVVLWLGLAAVSSVVCFLLLNPAVVYDFGLFEHDFGATLRDYARKGAMAGATGTEAAVAAIRWFTDPIFHGPWIGFLAFAGAGGLAARWLAGIGGGRRVEHLLLLGLPAGYASVYILVTQNPGGWHNWLVLTPFTALYAAWAAAAIGRGLTTRLPSALGGPARWLGAAALLTLAGGPFLVSTYQAAVPETWVLGRDRLREVVPRERGRIVFQEVAVPAPLGFARGQAVKPGVFGGEPLWQVAADRLDLGDVELFDAASLEGPHADFYRRRLERVDSRQKIRIESGFLRGRGPEIWIVVHPLPVAGPPARLALERRERRRVAFVGKLERRRARAPRLVSFGFWLPKPAAEQARPVLEANEAVVGLTPALDRRGTVYYLSERIDLPSGTLKLRLEPVVEVEVPSLAIDLFGWRPPAD